MESWRPFCSSGNTFADGCSEPFLQKSGLFGPRKRALKYTRPCASIIALCRLEEPSHNGSLPQYAEGCIGRLVDDGVPGCTGCLMVNARLFTGSTAGMLSVLSSGAPNTGPLALTRGSCW